jgi:ketosteroid isomerase-like protein
MEVPAGHEPEWVVAANNDVEKKNAEAATAFYATWEKKDSKAFLDSLTEDAQHLDFSRPADGQKGKAAAKKDFDAFIKAFPDMKMNVKNMWAAGPYVVLESQATGTFKGALGPLKPTQKTGTLHGLDVMKLADGKLALGHSYGSGAEFAGAFGLMAKDAGKPPAKPAGGAKAPSTPLPPPGLPPAGGAKPGGGAKPTPPPAGGPKPPPPPGGAKPPAPGAKPPAAGAKPPAPPAGAKPPAAPAPKPPAPKP